MTDCVKRPSSSLCRLRRFKIVNFTLQYITIKKASGTVSVTFCARGTREGRHVAVAHA